jgi:hypothetical protein
MFSSLVYANVLLKPGPEIGFVAGVCDHSLAFYLYLIALLILQLDNAVKSSSALVSKASPKVPLILQNELVSQRSLVHVDIQQP